MGYTTPITWAVRQQLTAALMNEQVRDNISHLYDNLLGQLHAHEQASRTSAWSTTSTDYVDVSDLSVEITLTKQCDVLIFLQLLADSTGPWTLCQILQDGSSVSGALVLNTSTTEEARLFMLRLTNVAAGTYTFKVQAKMWAAGTLTLHTMSGVTSAGKLTVLAFNNATS